MKSLIRKFFAPVVALILTGAASESDATLIDVTDPSYQHFGDFPNVNYPGDYSKISGNFLTDPSSRDFGWHFSPASGPSISGIILNPNSFVVTALTFQVHSSPFRDFLLQASTDTTDGFDGTWTTLLSSTVTTLIEQEFQTWSFSNNSSYSAYRIHALNDYQGHAPNFPIGWAMYRWELLAESETPVPEPGILGLFAASLMGIGLMRRLKDDRPGRRI